MTPRRLVVPEVLGVFPDAVARHLQTIGQRQAPLRSGRGFAPVVGDLDGFAVLESKAKDVVFARSYLTLRVVC